MEKDTRGEGHGQIVQEQGFTYDAGPVAAFSRGARMNRPYFEIANPEIFKIIEDLPRGLQVLDVGCGSGVHGAELNAATATR